MTDREWTETMEEIGIPRLEIVGNIIRWENYRSLFCLFQLEGSNNIMVFDSGKGYGTGMYSWGRRVRPGERAPTFEELFESYGIAPVPTVIRFEEDKNLDAEQRMFSYFSDEEEEWKPQLEGRAVRLVTGASPCNKTCTGLMIAFKEIFSLSSLSIRFFRPYTTQDEADYALSLLRFDAAHIFCEPILDDYVDPNIWIGVKDSKQVIQLLQQYHNDTVSLQKNIRDYSQLK